MITAPPASAEIGKYAGKTEFASHRTNRPNPIKASLFRTRKRVGRFGPASVL